MMFGIGVEFAFLHWMLEIRFHPLRWVKKPGIYRSLNLVLADWGPFSIEWEDVR